MRRNLGSSPHVPPAAPVPAARAKRPGWRDPRLWVGVAIVAGSVVAGARLLAAADDTVGVWAVRDELGPGATLDADDLVARRVRFADDVDLGSYLLVSRGVPDDTALLRAVGPGELLPRAALGRADESGLVEVPLSVEPEQVPPSVGSGSVVDVYVLGRPGEEPGDRSGVEPALQGATVVEAPAMADSFGTTGRQQLVLAVPEDRAPAFFALLQQVESPTVSVVRRR